MSETIKAREVKVGQHIRFTYTGLLATVLDIEMTEEGLVAITTKQHGEGWRDKHTLIGSYPVYIAEKS